MGFLNNLLKKHSAPKDDKTEQQTDDSTEIKEEKGASDNKSESKTANDEEQDSANVAYFSMVGNTQNTPLYRLYRMYCEKNNMEIMEPYDFIEDMFFETNSDGIFLTSVEKKSFLYNCLSELNKIYANYESEKDAAFNNFRNGIIANARKKAAENNEDEMDAELKAVENLDNPFQVYDALVNCYTTKDDMVSYCIITPNIGEGKPLSKEVFNSALEKNKITTNIDEEKTAELLESPKFFRFIRIAKGKKAVDGQDGFVEDLFSRNQSIKLKENQQGQVDYKNLGTFSPIKKNDVICKITKAVAGEPGITVKGKSLKAYNGKEAVIPRGEGTVLSDDGLSLLAGTDGFITFERGNFIVKQKMFVEGNVDSSTGNIVFNGDVEVKGDVNAGFTIDVTGNIKIFGVVEGAILKAGGDISLKGGVSGNNTAKLVAGGVVKSLFLENCEVQSNGGVFTESIIQSDIYSDTIVDCLMGKGAIIGGNIHAKEGIMANVIGSRAGKLTNCYIGKSHSATNKQEELEEMIKTEEESYDKISKNVVFLENLPSIPENKLPLYEQLKEQQLAYAQKIQEDKTALETLIKQRGNYDKCLFKTGVLYEPVKLQIGNAQKNLPAGNAVCYKYSAEEKDIVSAPYH